MMTHFWLIGAIPFIFLMLALMSVDWGKRGGL